MRRCEHDVQCFQYPMFLTAIIRASSAVIGWVGATVGGARDGSTRLHRLNRPRFRALGGLER